MEILRGCRFPGAGFAVAALHLDRLLPGSDDGTAARDLGSILRLAPDRLRHLFPVWTKTQFAGGALASESPKSTFMLVEKAKAGDRVKLAS